MADSQAQVVFRAGEAKPPPPRVSRTFSSDNGWYFRTREGKVVGPYLSEEEATRSVMVFTDFASKLSPERIDDLLHYYLKNVDELIDVHQWHKRKGETSAPPTRTDRVKGTADEWFFKTREGKSVGPYHNYEEAKKISDIFGEFAGKLSAERIEKLLDTYLHNINKSRVSAKGEPLRRGEYHLTSQRSKRLVHDSGGWYFQTREGPKVGPYDSEDEVIQTVEMYGEFARKISKDRLLNLIDTLLESRRT